ncbi:peptidase M50 [Pyrolobus fumarii 1A]|uniref:Peptidase M50 n=1 Tax=Pyrolobus fumarii (strain DSM 11204 / 1A) TaxID=694429 RepID=G0EDJ6_PYRF1|nr:site-2 protease family protein [Pyrolobus fumarii]AEM39800.1 peptidase M50 [Pyrolobus fumarii 1A]
MSSQQHMQSDDLENSLCSMLTKCFEVVNCDGRSAFVYPRLGWVECFDSLIDEYEEAGYQPKLFVLSEGLGVVFLRIRKGFGKAHVLLLTLATILTVLLAGFDVATGFARVSGVTGTEHNTMLLAVSFLAGLLGPLAIHESGHFLAARRVGVPVSAPMFIPAPPLRLGGIGTFGAIISMRGIPRDRSGLGLVGVAGPLAGFLAGLVVAVIGGMLSPSLPASLFKESVREAGIEASFAPLVLLLVLGLFHGGSGEAVIVLHPLAFAAFIVFIVTFLNLLPIGQLDGGHIVYAVFGAEVHNLTSSLVPVLALILALVYPQLSIIAIFAMLAYALHVMIGKGVHPGVLNPVKPLPPRRAALYAGIYVVLLILTFPVPL